jgi:xylan 1,4-beta-xylosidase
VTPIVELSFMPAILAGCTWTSPRTGKIVNPGKAACKTKMQYKGVTKHPQNWEDWHDLVKALVQHAVDKFGMSEVEKWRFEVND